MKIAKAILLKDIKNLKKKDSLIIQVMDLIERGVLKTFETKEGMNK